MLIHLINLQRVSIKQPRISWDNVTKLYADNITWNQYTGILLIPSIVS